MDCKPLFDDRRIAFCILAILACSWTSHRAMGQDIPTVIAQKKSVQVLMRSVADAPMHYLAFPAVLDLGQQVLISFKRGRSHAADVGATIDWLRLDKQHQKVVANGVVASIPGEIMQMGEWVRFSDGTIGNYIDAQKTGSLRSGLCVARSTDNGFSFGAVERVGAIDGVEYGYAFDSITHNNTTNQNNTTWMLVMTFANLPGGKRVHSASSQPGSVDIVKTINNGESWQFVRSITGELDSAPINESAMVRYQDGFLVTARGYDGRQWLMRMDGQFKLQAKAEWNEDYSFIHSHIGRPRLMERDGSFYLLGRNHVEDKRTQLGLFQFDPESLRITRHMILDGADGKPAGDSYYAQCYWRDVNDRTTLNVVTYKRGEGPAPEIVQFQFDWKTLIGK